MRSIRSAMVIALSLLIVACSVPDGDDIKRLTDTIAGWPSAVKAKTIRYAMNRRAIEWLMTRPQNEEIGRVNCHRAEDGSLVEVSVRVVEDAIRCLLENPALIYVECVENLTSRTAELANGEAKRTLAEKFGELKDCYDETPFVYQSEYVEDDLVEPSSWTDEDIARALISIPGPLPGGPVPGMLPVLCPLAEDPESWGCPGSPEYPPGETPEPGDEGDR